MYKRVLFDNIKRKIGKGKAIILLGPRQVGKTTLMNEILNGKEHLFLNGDDPTVRTLLDTPNTEQIKNIIGNHTTVYIDEAQRINNIGLTLKIITDQFKHVQLLVTGSSAFELSNKMNEPLTGRKWEYHLYPISWKEFESHLSFLKAEQQLELRLIYGFYPEVLNHFGEEKEVLKELVSSYLYKDILAYSGIRKPEVLEKLLQALALQICQEVSYNELAQLIGVDKKTISQYIDILEKAYIVRRLGTFSRNLRNEIKTNKKIYFYDLGIRNALLGNFDQIQLRSDKGYLWENFLVMERLKKISYENKFTRSYFWRTKQQQEIDYVEEENGNIYGFEFKWQGKSKYKKLQTFTEAYQTSIQIIDRSNFRDFVI
ncbi:MAG: ATP-binding protein [Cyclobacteriaceae bacterium]|nr:ATP-binding protein [Cyclobacteriaceae bacterium]